MATAFMTRATGFIGGRLLGELAAGEEFDRIHCLLRKPDERHLPESEKIPVFRGDVPDSATATCFSYQPHLRCWVRGWSPIGFLRGFSRQACSARRSKSVTDSLRSLNSFPASRRFLRLRLMELISDN